MPYLLFESSRIRIPLNQEALIGREGLDVVVETDSGVFKVGKDPTVSRRHAKIYRHGNTYYITDLGSRNGTYVDGKLVKTEPLQFGQLIRVGYETIFRFVNSEEEYFTEKTLILTTSETRLPDEFAYKVPFGDKVIFFIKPLIPVEDVKIDDEPKKREEINKSFIYAVLQELRSALRENDKRNVLVKIQALRNIFDDELISSEIRKILSNCDYIRSILDLIARHPEYLETKGKDLMIAVDAALEEIKIKALMR